MTERDQKMKKRTLHMNATAYDFGVTLQKAPKKTPPPHTDFSGSTAKTAPPHTSSGSTAQKTSAGTAGAQKSAQTYSKSAAVHTTERQVLRSTGRHLVKLNTKDPKGRFNNPLKLSYKKETAAQGVNGSVNVDGKQILFYLPPWPDRTEIYSLRWDGKDYYFQFDLDVSGEGGFACSGCLSFILLLILAAVGFVLPPLAIGLLIFGVLSFIIAIASGSSARKQYDKDAALYRQQSR